MSVVLVYLAVLAVFLIVDAVWLKLVMRPLFERHVGEMLREDPDLLAAAGFYALYCAGVVYFAVAPSGGALWPAFRDGAILGFLAYGTYEATNLATLKGWDWRMVATDVAWGMALTGVSAVAGALVL